MATNAILTQFLQPQVILRVISRIRDKYGFMGRFFGFQPDRFDPDSVTMSGPNTLNNAVANSVAFSTGSQKIGGAFMVYSNPAGTKWIVINESAGSNTITVA